MYRSTETGIIYNNVMTDFGTESDSIETVLPMAPGNVLHRGKTPASSMTPAIITDKYGDVKFVIGGTGGSRIISAVVLVSKIGSSTQ